MENHVTHLRIACPVDHVTYFYAILLFSLSLFGEKKKKPAIFFFFSFFLLTTLTELLSIGPLVAELKGLSAVDPACAAEVDSPCISDLVVGCFFLLDGLNAL